MSGVALVLGAGGQLGRELLATAPAEVTLRAATREQLDITDASAVAALLQREKPDVVFNAAAYTAVDKAESEPALAFAINAEAPGLLAQWCAAHGSQFVHVSTDFVFNGRAQAPYVESDTTAPLGQYGLSKLAGEQAVTSAYPDATLVRTGWVYSRHGHNFVKTMLRLMTERDQLSVVSDQVGTPTWAKGLARACWGLAAQPGCFHWSDNGQCSWFDFAVAIRDLARERGLLLACPEITPIATADYPTPAARPAYSVLDKRRSWEALGTKGLPWREQLAAMLDELQQEQSRE